MIPTLLAQVPGPAADASSSYVATGLVVVGLSALVQLALAAKQLLAPAKSDSSLDPASLRAIAVELHSQTATLHKLDREMGGVVTTIAALQRELSEIKAAHVRDLDATQQRVAGLGRDLAGTIARVEGLVKRGHDL